MSHSQKNTLCKVLPTIGISLSALIWMGAPGVARAADPDIFDGDLVIPDPVVKYGLKKVLQNIKINLPGLPQIGSSGSSGSSGNSSSGGGLPMGSSGGGGLPMGSDGSLPSLGKSGQSGIGMQDGDSLGTGKGDNQGLGQEDGKGQMPGQGQGESGSQGDMISQGEGLGGEMDKPSAIPGDQAGENPMGDAQQGEGPMGDDAGAGEGNAGGDQNDGNGNQGMGGPRRGANITIGDITGMIETASQQGSENEPGEAENSDDGSTGKGLPMAGKNKGRSSGVERGESIPSDL